MSEPGSPHRSDAAVVPLTRPSLPPLEDFQALLPRLWATGTVTNGGPYVRELETRLTRFLPARNVCAVTNGTLALQLALRAVGGSQGVVITTPFTFAATTTALAWQGFTPRFADIDRETFILDPERVSDKWDRDVVGVLPVQVFGNPAGSRELAALARERSRWAIFDSAHSFGVKVSGGSLFDLGDASMLSFHATKSFHTFEGGAVTTSSRRLARRIERLRNFGFQDTEVTGDVSEPGINAKMTEPQAAVGLLNLRHLRGWIRARGERFRLYHDLLATLRVVEFQRVEADRPNFIYMPILLPNRRLRDRVYRNLFRKGIRPRRYYLRLTNQFSFVPRALRGNCPVAEEISERVLCLPLYHELPLDEVHRIADLVRDGLR